MFADKKASDRLKMCNNCHIVAMMEVDFNQLVFDTVMVTRTTEDYLRERDELRREAAKDMMKSTFTAKSEA
jgi:hypothetical protein